MTTLDVAGIAVSPDHYIDGRRVPSDQHFELQSPIDQRVLGRIAEGTAEHVEAAIVAAQKAFPAWSAMTAAERKPLLDRFAEEIGKRADDFCALESNDAGVLLSRMRHGVVPRAMLNIAWFAQHALFLQDRPIETEQAHHIVRHDPAGVIVIIMGAVFIGQVTFMQRTIKPQWKVATGLGGAPLLGIVFALGWTPCLGPTLIAVNSLALDGGDPARGALLAVAYCLGLGIPFLLVALGLNWVTGSVAWMKKHIRLINIIGGSLLVLVGLAMVTGVWRLFTSSLGAVIGGFETAF